MRTFLLSAVLFFLPLATHAMFLDAQIIPGVDGARVVVMVSPTTTPINALEGTLTLPQGAVIDKLYVGESVIQTWIEPPRIEGRSISFAGIIPGGFTGSAVPGAGLTGPAQLFSFEVVGSASPILLSEAALYVHNGQGTKIADAGGVLPETLVSGSAFQEEDRTPPEFVDVVAKTTQDFLDGHPVLFISGFDGESGIDRYEVQEGGGVWVRSGEVYEVQDSWGLSSLSVRAYDRAGNFIETRIAGRHASYLYLGYALMGLLLLSILSGILVYFRKRRARA